MQHFTLPLENGARLYIAARAIDEVNEASMCGFCPNAPYPRASLWRNTQPNDKDKLYKTLFPSAQIYAYGGSLANIDEAARRLESRPNYVYADDITNNYGFAFLNAYLEKGLMGPKRRVYMVKPIYDPSTIFHTFHDQGIKIVMVAQWMPERHILAFAGARDTHNSVMDVALKNTAWARLQLRPNYREGTPEDISNLSWVMNAYYAQGTRGYRPTVARELPHLEQGPKIRPQLPELEDVQIEWILEDKRTTCVAYALNYLGFIIYGAATIQNTFQNNVALGKRIALGRLHVRPVILPYRARDSWLKRIQRHGRCGPTRFCIK